MELKIGTIIKKLRTERGITQEELANKMNVSFQAVSKWENNQTTPDISILPQLALFFGVSIDTLFDMKKDDYIEKISLMIRDEHTVSNENFIWAERYLKGLLSEEPQNNTARTLLAELYAHRENRDSLAQGKLCEEGLLIEPSNSVLHNKLICVREKRNEFERLMRFYEDLLARHSKNVTVIEAAVSVYIKNRKFNEASDLLKKLPSEEKQILYFSDIEFAKGNEAAAKELLASIGNACDSKIAFDIAERFNKCEDIEKSIRYYKLSYETAPAPKPLDALYSLAFLYTNNHMKSKAIAVWELILSTLKTDYSITNGETVDWAKRELEALK